MGSRLPVETACRYGTPPPDLRSRGPRRLLCAAILALIAVSVLAAAEPEVFVVALTPPREGVEVRIDSNGYGITDAGGRLAVSIERGDHQVTLRLGQRSVTRVTGFYQSPVSIDIGATALLEPRRDYLLRTNVPGARVHVDGVFEKATDADGRSMLELLPGRTYSIEVKKDGYVTATRTFRAGETVNFFDLSLEKRPAPAPPPPPPPPPPAVAVDEPPPTEDTSRTTAGRAGGAEVADATEVADAAIGGRQPAGPAPAAGLEEGAPAAEIGAAAQDLPSDPAAPDRAAPPASEPPAAPDLDAAPPSSESATAETGRRAWLDLLPIVTLSVLAGAGGVGGFLLLRRWRASRRVDHRRWIREASRSITREQPLPEIPRYRIVDAVAQQEDSDLFLAEPVPPDGNRYVVNMSHASPLTRGQDPRRIEADTGQVRALVHRHIVPVHDAGLDRSSGRLYQVMPQLEATSLREYFRRFAPPPELDTLARIVLPILHALDYAHCLKPPVLHRHVRPESVLVESDGVGAIKDVKLMGFGVPPRQASGPASEISYVAPEVREGGQPSPASDLFGLGTILLEALGGSMDPSASGVEGNATKPLPNASPPVLRILAGLLARDPRERYASAREAILDCRDALFSAGGVEIAEPAPVPPQLSVH